VADDVGDFGCLDCLGQLQVVTEDGVRPVPPGLREIGRFLVRYAWRRGAVDEVAAQGVAEHDLIWEKNSLSSAMCRATLRTVTTPAFSGDRVSGTRIASLALKTAGSIIRQRSVRAATSSHSTQVSTRSRRPGDTAL
jgi:hypothetical protein